MSDSAINITSKNQQGSTLIFIIVLLPVMALILFSINSGSIMGHKAVGDSNQYFDVLNINDEAVLLTVRDPNQIDQSILKAKEGFEDTLETQEFIRGGAELSSEVTTKKISIPNTSPDILQGYLISVKVTAEKNGIETSAEQFLIEAGVP